MKQFSKAGIRLFVLSAAMTCALAVGAHAASTGTIDGGTINIRSGPGTDYARVTMLMTGKQVDVLGYQDGWYHIAWNGNEGYVLADYLITSGSSSSDSSAASSSQSALVGTVSGGTINVRSGPGTGYDCITTVTTGKRVGIAGSENGWYKVSFDGKTGYILGDYVSSGVSGTAGAQDALNGTVSGGDSINVRSGPGTDYSRVDTVAEGKQVEIIGSSGNWYKISYGGTTGYIRSDFLTAGSAAKAAPAETASTADTVTPPPAASETTIPDEATPLSSVESSVVNAADETSYDEPRSALIYGGTINVRTGPGTEYDRLTKLYTGDKISIIGESGDWYKISFNGSVGYVLSNYVYEGDSLPASSVGEQVAAMAQRYLGVPYVYGGSSPSGFDCSGLTMYLYHQFGYSLPHSASAQYSYSYRVSKSELQPGDLVFFTSSGYGGRITHVGVYIGNGNIVHARYSVGRVYMNNLSESYYTRNYVGAVRIA